MVVMVAGLKFIVFRQVGQFEDTDLYSFRSLRPSVRMFGMSGSFRVIRGSASSKQTTITRSCHRIYVRVLRFVRVISCKFVVPVLQRVRLKPLTHTKSHEQNKEHETRTPRDKFVDFAVDLAERTTKCTKHTNQARHPKHTITRKGPRRKDDLIYKLDSVCVSNYHRIHGTHG